MYDFTSAVVRLFLFLTLGAGLLVQPAQAQSSVGSVQGFVRTLGGGPVSGAIVSIEGTRLGSVTDPTGRFLIQNVPAGPQVLEARRIGYESGTDRITVPAGGTLRLEIVLRAAAVELPGLLVVGQGRIGQALEDQRTAINLVTVVSEEQLERFPDPNIADALQRLPGVSVQHSFGEANTVALRGLSGRFTNVTVNGERLSSTSTTGRGAQLDAIMADMISEVEVHRAITPAMDADAIGGSINLVTRTPEGTTPSGEVRLVTGYNEFTRAPQIQGTGRVGGRIGRFGYALDGSYRETDRSEEMLRYEWNFSGEDVSGLRLLQLNNYQSARQRFGLGGTMDFRASDRAYFYLRGNLNRYNDVQLTPEFNLNFGAGNLDAGSGLLTGAGTTGFARAQDRRRSIANLAGGGELAVGLMNLDYSLAYTRAEFDEPRQIRAVFNRSGVDFLTDFSDRLRPRFSPAEGSDPFDPSGYVISDLRVTNDNALDTDFTASSNLEVPLVVAELPLIFRVGGKVSRRERDRDENYTRWSARSAFRDQIRLTDFASDFRNDNFYGGDYRLGTIPDPDALAAYFEANRDQFQERVADSRESDFGTYVADEDISAAYGMVTTEVGPLLIVGGARYEHTQTGYTGGQVVLDNEGDYVETVILSEEQSYGSLYPMLHLRYSVGDATNLRFAATRTLARPDFYDLVPWRSFNGEDQEIEEGNPALRPTQSVNFDLSAEHFFGGTGLFSVGLFAKSLTDFIYESSTDVTIPGFVNEDGELAEEFELVRMENGGSATVRGVEVSWQQDLDFLPTVLSGLGIFANYTYIDSDGEVEGTDRTIQIPDLSPHLLNVAMLYDRGGFSGNLSMHLQSGYLSRFSSSPARTEYFDQLVRFDLAATQRITPNARVFAEVNNLTNALYQVYFGDRGTPHERIYYGRWVDLGLRYSF